MRASHAANEGKIFAWDRPPVTGHPGEDINCRCWAEPYFGVSDSIGDFLFLLPIVQFSKFFKTLLRLVRDINAGTLSKAQAENLGRFDKKLPKDAGEIQIIKGPNGQRIFRSDVPAKNIPGSFARYEKVVDRVGNTVSYTKTTYGPNSEVVSIKVKYGE